MSWKNSCEIELQKVADLHESATIFLAVFCLLESVFLGPILLDIIGGDPGVQNSVQEGYDEMPTWMIFH